MIMLTDNDFTEDNDFDINNDIFRIYIEVKDCDIHVPIIIQDMYWSD